MSVGAGDASAQRRLQRARGDGETHDRPWLQARRTGFRTNWCVTSCIERADALPAGGAEGPDAHLRVSVRSAASRGPERRRQALAQRADAGAVGRPPGHHAVAGRAGRVRELRAARAVLLEPSLLRRVREQRRGGAVLLRARAESCEAKRGECRVRA